MATFSGPEQMGESPFRKINDNVVVQMKFKLKLGHHSLILYFRLPALALLFMHGPL